MSRLFTSGAEAASLGVFTAAGAGASISAVQKRTGAYSFYQSAQYGAFGSAALGGDKTVLYFRVGLYLISLASTWIRTPLIQLYDSAGWHQCMLAFNPADRLLHVLKGYWGSYVDLGVAVHPVPLNQWCCIEWYIKIGESPDGESTVKLDGATEITISGVDTRQTAVAGARTLMYGAGDLASSRDGMVGYLDDLAINDSAGAVNNSWIGRGGIYGVVPEGVGAYTDLHAQGHANPWDCISEVPPDDADYVYDDTVDQKSTYALTALTPTTGTIACINVIMRAKLDAVGTGNIARLIRSNGTDSQGADVGLDTSPKTIQENIETDPSGGGAWTISRINALEAGAVVR